MPRREVNSFHQVEEKVEPRSEMMWSGRPCGRKTLWRKWRARVREESVVLAGTKWASLVKRSTTTKIASKLPEGGSGPM